MIQPDLETLKQYTELGIKLAPINDYNAYVENDLNSRFTNDIEAIKAMINGKYIFNETTLPKGTPIKIFRFMPQSAGLFCLDFDVKNEIDGLHTFKNILQKRKLDLKDTFNKTAFVNTPNSGYHFYFKFRENYKGDFKNSICVGVEIKYKLPLTAAGSVKKGKLYKLNGVLENALPLPELILKMAMKKKPRPKEKRFYYKPSYEGNRPSLDYLLAEAIEEDTGHNKRAFLFACKCRRNHYTPEQALEMIYNNPQIFGTDRDLKTTLDSAFKAKGEQCKV